MISASKAKEMVNLYYAKKKGEYEQTAEHKLELINNDIKCYAQYGSSSVHYSNRASFFPTQQIEDIVTEKLQNLGYTVITEDNRFIVKWDT